MCFGASVAIIRVRAWQVPQVQAHPSSPGGYLPRRRRALPERLRREAPVRAPVHDQASAGASGLLLGDRRETEGAENRPRDTDASEPYSFAAALRARGDAWYRASSLRCMPRPSSTMVRVASVELVSRRIRVAPESSALAPTSMRIVSSIEPV